ncbi:MAG: M81 family metallopeptidase [Rhodospirillales bacterium]|jgi:microcystin degradation protein MlrC|nr:M81 family metallopeptidase [Rhodospirillales bacterium]HJO97266.1 M81 family metallopeptidase [Rhodospirillales bacterium]
MARIAIGGIRHETNTFAPASHKADLEDYLKGGAYPALCRGPAISDAVAGMNLCVSGFMDEARARGHEIVPLLWCHATPSAHTTERAFETIAGWLFDDLASAGPIDAFFLDLHGAMVTEHLEDGDGELLRRARAAVGPRVPVVSAIDFHAIVTPAMIENATAMHALRTYPHVDRAETGWRTARHLHDLLQGGDAPFKAWRKIPFLISAPCQCTLAEPTRSIMAILEELEGGDVEALNFTPGFPSADVHDLGPTVFGCGRDRAAVEAAVAALAEEVEGREAEFAGAWYSAEEGVRRAMRTGSQAAGPVLLADTQDNPGGGGTSDTTGLLKALVEQEATDAVLAMMFDGEAAQRAHEAGQGAEIELALGGRSGIPGDTPLRARFTVERLGDGTFEAHGPMMAGMTYRLGPMALLRIGGVGVVVSGTKSQALDQGILRHLGVDPAAQKIVALKSSVHFRADFAEMASDILVVLAPGAVIADTSLKDYRKLRPGVRLAPLGPVSGGG